MKIHLALFISFFSLLASAQKDTSQQLSTNGIKSLYVNTDEVFKINLKSTKGDMILISAHAEGEYFNDISLSTEMRGNAIYLSTQFREILQSGYDKLSAHKVFSLEVTIEVPEKMEVSIKSNIASVEAQGAFKFVEAQLNSGYCNLSDFSGNALINTLNGGISIQTTNATVTATSRNGTVIMPPNFNGKNVIKATSINGDISVVEN